MDYEKHKFLWHSEEKTVFFCILCIDFSKAVL